MKIYFYSKENLKWSQFKEFEDSLLVLTSNEISDFEFNSLVEDESVFLYEIRNHFHQLHPTAVNWTLFTFEQRFEEDNKFRLINAFDNLVDEFEELKNIKTILKNQIESWFININYHFIGDLENLPESVKNIIEILKTKR